MAIELGRIECIAWLLRQPTLQLDDARLETDSWLTAALDSLKQRSHSPAETVQYEKIEALIRWRLLFVTSELSYGINWTTNLGCFFGGKHHKHKSISIPGETTHERLQQWAKSDIAARGLLIRENERGDKVLVRQKSEADAGAEPEFENVGNRVYAAITFICSNQAHVAGGNHQRIAVTMQLPIFPVAERELHVTHFSDRAAVGTGESHDELFSRRIRGRLERLSRVPEGALTAEEIAEVYQGTDAHQQLHHSEQALYDALEDAAYVRELIRNFSQTAEFRFGCKVSAVVLDIHSVPNYICANVEAGALALQHSHEEGFLNLLADNLKEIGCKLPVKTALPMITRISALGHGVEKSYCGEHKLYMLILKRQPESSVRQDIVLLSRQYLFRAQGLCAEKITVLRFSSA